MKIHFLLLGLFLSPLSAFSQDVPGQLLEKINTAFQFIEEPSHNCQVILHTEFKMSNPNGKKPFTSTSITRLTSRGDGSWEREILEEFQDGDAMEEESDRSSGKEEEQEEEENFKMILPVGEDIEKFSFELIGRYHWSFIPLDEFKKEKGITAGEIQYHPDSEEILLIADFVKPPTLVSEMHLEFTLKDREDFPVPVRMDMSGEGGFLMIRKVFNTSMIWKDYQRLSS